MKFVKLNDRHINTEHIVSVSEDDNYYYVRMSNADAYRVDKKSNKKLIQGILNETPKKL